MSELSYKIARVLFCLILVALMPVVAWADAGKVIFVSGTAKLATGATLERGATVNAGDEIVTGEDGRVQLLMEDGDRIAIRPNSSFLIEVHQATGDEKAVPRSPIEGKRVYNLLKGGLRTLTDKEWARDEDSYQVKTPVATIGIRGTDYELLLVQVASSPSGYGLYIAVYDGRVWVKNNSTYTEVYDGEFLYLESVDDPGAKLLGPPAPLYDGDVPSSGFWVGPNTSGIDTEKASYESRRSPTGSPNYQVDPDPPIDPEIPVITFSATGQLILLTEGFFPVFRYNAFSANALSGAVFELINGYQVNGTGDLVAFPGIFATGSGLVQGVAQLGSSTIVNRGLDETSGLRWGRWAGGQATIVGSSDTIDLSNQSLHWITANETLLPTALPISGTYMYRLVGNTDPTDNFGNAGFMDGRSYMHADFTNQRISTQIGVGINDQRWLATDSDGRFGPGGTFAGQFDSVQTTGGNCGNGCSGSGGYSGFFTGGDGSGPPPGVGMGYNMEQGGNEVSGAAAFGDPQ